MKKLLLSLVLVFISTGAFGQCGPSDPAGTACGRAADAGTGQPSYKSIPAIVGVQDANSVFSGPVSGAPALPSFKPLNVTAIKTPVTVATTANITLSGEQTIDGVLTSASRVLVKNQSTASQNGIYVSAAGAWTRAVDWNATGQIVQGTEILVNSGSTNELATFKVTTASPITIGSTSVAFASTANISAGDYYRYNGQLFGYAQTTLDNWYFAKAGNLTGTGLDNFAMGPGAGVSFTTATHNFLGGAFTGGAITSGESITCLAYNSCSSLTTAQYVTGLGVNACRDGVTSSYVVCVGVEAFLRNLANFNTGLGNAVGYNNTTGTQLTWVGAGSGHGDLADIIASTASFGTGIGTDSCGQIRTADYVFCGGWKSQYENLSSPSNTSSGAESSKNLVSGVGENATFGRAAGQGGAGATYSLSTFLGMNSGFAATSATRIAATGHSSLVGCTTCDRIVASGYFAGQTVTTAARGLILGPEVATTTWATGSNVILLGTSNKVDAPLAATSDFMNLTNVIYATDTTGTLAAPAGKVGIKIVAPTNDLDVLGTIGATGQIVSTLATGTAPFSVASTTQVANLYAARAALADTVTTNANLTGDVTSVGNATTLTTTQPGAHTWTLAQTDSALHQFNLGANISSGQTLSWNSDLFLYRAAAATLQLGAANAASPVNQTIQVQGSRAGTDSNTAGANLTVTPGLGTGQALGSNITFNVPVALAGSGSTVQTLAQAFKIGSVGSGGTPGNPAVIFRTDEITIGPSALVMYSANKIGWGASTVTLGQTTTDTNLTRASAGIINVGTTGSTADGSMNLTNLTATGYVKTGVVAVGSLPTCNAGAEGARMGVNDSNAVSFTAGIGAIVAAGGTTHVPVYCDGTNWRIG